MSYISKALKRIQETRESVSEKKIGDIVYLTDAPKTWHRTLLMLIFVFITVMAVLNSSVAIILTMRYSNAKQAEIELLKKTVVSQEKRIKDLVEAINKNEKVRDNQIQGLDLRLKKESIEAKSNLNYLTTTENTQYIDIKNTISADQDNITLLNKYINILNQRLEEVTAKENQVSNLLNPATTSN